MPGRAEVVRAYVEGRKFKTLKTEKDYNFPKLEPYIIPSRRRGRQLLFCALTNRYLNRKPAEVDLHLRGRRYKRALEKYSAGLLSLCEERLGKKKKERVGEESDDQMEMVGEEGEGENGGGGEGEEGEGENGERGEGEEGEGENGEGGEGEEGEGENGEGGEGDSEDDTDLATPLQTTKAETVRQARKRRPVTTLHSTQPTKQPRSMGRKRRGGKLR